MNARKDEESDGYVMRAAYYIGLMTGTSMDGVDAALVDFSDDQHRLIEAHHQAMPQELKQQIQQLALGCDGELAKMASLDRQLGQLFAAVVDNLLNKSNCTKDDIVAIGSHGQTLRHAPDASPAYTIQIGDPNTLAAETGITVIADFRRRDIALGGQGAPFAPIYHQALFADVVKTTAVVNIGGIANISCLGECTTGFDSGPGNCLMDAHIQKEKDIDFDRDGAWAASGRVDDEFLCRLLDDPYFSKAPPKSTGPDYFNLSWLSDYLPSSAINADDIQATLCELTAVSIKEVLNYSLAQCQRLIVCGGGVHNNHLIRRISYHITADVISSQTLGICPDNVEAMMFAWFAKQRHDAQPVDMRSVTGARKPYVPGCVYLAY